MVLVVQGLPGLPQPAVCQLMSVNCTYIYIYISLGSSQFSAVLAGPNMFQERKSQEGMRRPKSRRRGQLRRFERQTVVGKKRGTS